MSKPELTPNDLEFITALLDAKAEAAEADSRLAKISRSCKHKIYDDDGFAVCALCERDWGWYCPESPDHLCHYFAPNGKVVLANGEVEEVPVGKEDPKYWSYDYCLYCGQPEERK